MSSELLRRVNGGEICWARVVVGDEGELRNGGIMAAVFMCVGSGVYKQIATSHVEH